MSTPQRRRELAAEREAQDIRDEEERNRLEARSMYERIEDLNSWREVKDILHSIDERLDALEEI